MININQDYIVRLVPVEKVREYYRINKKLFGLISAEQILKRESVGNELRIYCEKMPKKVYINGKLIRINP